MDGNIEDLSKYRFRRAEEELDNAKVMFAERRYKLALNRSYYAIFHAMRAVNVLDGFDSSKHSGVISHFNQYHVKTGDFPKKQPKLFVMPQKCVNRQITRIFFVVAGKDAEEQVQMAEFFVLCVLKYLNE